MAISIDAWIDWEIYALVANFTDNYAGLLCQLILTLGSGAANALWMLERHFEEP